ncbi:MAG TPA: hypothetical protein VFW30_02175 [Bryocella sp.]|nr:hypothetical protein [Bryocella sp.]
MQTFRSAPVRLFAPLLVAILCPAMAHATKVHTVALGATRKVPYTPPEATPDTKDDDATSLRVRPLIVDDKQREWTVGPIHEVTDRTFVVQRALHLNDGLPGEAVHWTWQPGPWLMVDRTTGHVTALHLPDFDPQVSDVVWFRDYAAYCGIATTAKGGLMAVVAELGARKAVVQQKLSAWPQPDAPHPVCALSKWQRTPMRATIQQTGGRPMTFDVVGVSSLIEEGEASDE